MEAKGFRNNVAKCILVSGVVLILISGDSSIKAGFNLSCFVLMSRDCFI